MSAVRDFYNEHHSSFDDLHKLLDREPELRALFPPIRQQMLSCCGAQPMKGKVELVVVDTTRWDELAKEQAAIQSKLDSIQKMIDQLDSIFEEMTTKGAELPGNKTVRGLWAVESSHRTPGKMLDSPTWTGKTHSPSVQDPQYLDWAQRANAALHEAEQALKA